MDAVIYKNPTNSLQHQSRRLQIDLGKPTTHRVYYSMLLPESWRPRFLLRQLSLEAFRLSFKASIFSNSISVLQLICTILLQVTAVRQTSTLPSAAVKSIQQITAIIFAIVPIGCLSHTVGLNFFYSRSSRQKLHQLFWSITSSFCEMPIDSQTEAGRCTCR